MEARDPYPKRNIPEKSYRESGIPTDDIIYCDICMQEYVDGCKVHILTVIKDRRVPIGLGLKDRARHTVPKGWLKVFNSKIENGGEGVWTLRPIPYGIRFGPYEGLISTCNVDRSYCWQIRRERKVLYMDGSDTRIANWMRYVNCARNSCEQNLIAYQYCGSIYYRTITDIPANCELLVFYGKEYARRLGVDVANYYQPPHKGLLDNYFKCSNCDLVFKTPASFLQHLGRCNYYSTLTIRQPPTDATNTCEFCNLNFLTNNSYENHIKNAHITQITLSLETNLKTKKSKEKKKRQNNECPYCFKYFSAPYYLKRHLSSHSDDRPYKCDLCNGSFKRQYNLNRHKRRHDKNEVYECDICNETFMEYDTFVAHRRTHVNYKRHKCNICNKAFKRLDVMNKHRYIHMENFLSQISSSLNSNNQ